MLALLREDVTVYFLFLTKLSAQQWMAIYVSLMITGYILEILSFTTSLYLFGFLSVFSSATKIMITNKKQIIFGEVMMVILCAHSIFLIYHYDAFTQIIVILLKLSCVGYIFYMLVQASIYDVYLKKKWNQNKDRFDGVETKHEFNPNKIRDTLNMHTMEKIRDIILILGILAILISCSIDTFSIAINTISIAKETSLNQSNLSQSSLIVHDQINRNDNICDKYLKSNQRQFCEWLKNDVGLIQYLANFENHGFDDVRIINDIKEKDLRDMNVLKPGHIKIIMKCVATHQKQRYFPPQGHIP